MTSAFTKQHTSAPPKFDFVAAHFQCETDRYSESNPTGFVNLGSAQNELHRETIERRLMAVDSATEDRRYRPFAGTDECHRSIADYLGELGGVPVSPEHLVVGNGIISLLESLTVALLDEDESVLIPTPVFPGLVAAMGLRVRSRVRFLHTEAASDFRLFPADLESRLRKLAAEGEHVRAILLTSPGNPIGQVFSLREMQQFLAIAEAFDCALIVDEVYAGSVFSDQPFESATALQSDNVHVLGGLSKDFGLAGYATGWIHSTNQAVLAAVAKQSHFFRLPAPVQRVISTMLEPDWRRDYLRSHRESLSLAYETARRTLQASGIDVVEANAGLCLWINLRKYLPTPDLDGEFALYERLLNEHRVHISPGTGFKTESVGFFRLCFSQPPELLMEGLRRIIEGLRAGTDSDRGLSVAEKVYVETS
ncbi:MAG: pyridoxal phosphate-dependent aminotransferase [Planctomycetota bacterium]